MCEIQILLYHIKECEGWWFVVSHLGRQMALDIKSDPVIQVPLSFVSYPGIPVPKGIG